MRFLALLLALQLAIAAPVAQTSPSDTIPGKYIVVLKKESTIDALDTESAVEILGTTPDSQFQIGDFRGMSFDASEVCFVLGRLHNKKYLYGFTVLTQTQTGSSERHQK